jgi:glycosyltransferase involved in cell wall biosynthesis
VTNSEPFSAGGGVKILLLTADFPPHAWSGIAAAVSNQAAALAEAGAKVAVLTRSQYFSSPLAASGRLEVRGLDEPRFPFRGSAFDWIHLHSLSLSELAFELRARFETRLAYTAHSVIGHELEAEPARTFWSDLQIRVMHACDRVIVLSESERAALFSLAPEAARRAVVIPNPVPEPVLKKGSYDAAGPVVFAGRFAAQKGIAMLRKILPGVRCAWPGRFVLAGGHGDAQGEAAVRELRILLGDAVSTPGWLSRTELDELFASASLVLAPSRYEPFGMVALEAMRAGAPVLAARVGGLAEIVTDQSGGRLVGSADPSVWRTEILNLLGDETGTRALAGRGPVYVKSHFSPKIAANRLMKKIYIN